VERKVFPFLKSGRGTVRRNSKVLQNSVRVKKERRRGIGSNPPTREKRGKETTPLLYKGTKWLRGRERGKRVAALFGGSGKGTKRVRKKEALKKRKRGTLPLRDLGK